MKYISTRGKSPELNFCDVLFSILRRVTVKLTLGEFLITKKLKGKYFHLAQFYQLDKSYQKASSLIG